MKKAVFAVGLMLSVRTLPVMAEQRDAAEIVRQSVANYEHDWKEGIKWTYQQTDVMGRNGSTVTEVSEVGPLFGTPYERLISRNGKLTPDQEKHEEEKQAKARQTRENESPQQRAARISKYQNDRAFFKEIPQAYNFRILGEPAMNGRSAWEIEMKPKPGYPPRNTRSAMLKHIEGTLWIDKQELRWIKATAEVTDTISIGWILARVGPGAEFTLEQQRVAPNFWMPKTIDVKASAKVILVRSKDLTEHLTYSDFHNTGHDLETVTESRGNPAVKGHSLRSSHSLR